MKPLLVFDMDGVLVDVTESYREAIAQTVAHFTGAAISNERIQEYKNAGGFNDDWELTHRIVRDSGVETSFAEVKSRFQRLFLGERPVGQTPCGGPLGTAEGRPGGGPQTRGSAPPAPEALILRERWIARPGVLEKLSQRFRFAVFTGRPREEAAITLRRFAGGLEFERIIAMEDVQNHKPHPEGLRLAIEGAPRRAAVEQASSLRPPAHRPAAPGVSPAAPAGTEVAPQAFYIGDSVDDARCARSAGVRFIGITAPSNPRYLDLVFLFQAEKAYAIVDDINYLEEALAP